MSYVTQEICEGQRPVMKNRFWVHIRASEFNGHRGVRFTLFRPERLPEEVYAENIPAHLDRTCPYLQSAVEQTFSADEVEGLRAWFATQPQCVAFEVKAALPIDGPNQAGVGAIGEGGCDGYFRFSEEEGWSPPFKAWGYYDLEQAEAGPCVTNPDLALTRVSATEDGKPVVKLPPFYQGPEMGPILREVFREEERE